METIGIIGGMGPLAGLDLHRKILEETRAERDQEHLNIVHVAYPSCVSDRTAWLLAREGQNPGRGILDMVNSLALLKVTVAGMPCNTAHAHEIAGLVRFVIGQASIKLKLLDMIAETAKAVVEESPGVHRIGLLATTGTVRARVYEPPFSKYELELVVPDVEVQERVHAAINDSKYGIKAGEITERARDDLAAAARHLAERGAETAILGCTELPLAITEPSLCGLPTIDPTRVLARALVRAVDPEKLVTRALAGASSPD